MLANYSSVLLRPSRSRQLRRRSGLPAGSASAESRFDSVATLSGGGFGVDRPLRAPLAEPPEDDVPPTRRRVGVRRMPVLPLSLAAVSFGAGATSGARVSTGVRFSTRSATLLAAGFRERGPEIEGRRVLVAVEAGLRELERRAVAALVAALSSPFGDAASSETSGREATAARDRVCDRVIHSPVKYVLFSLIVTSATRPDSADMFISNAATSTCLPTSLTACRAG